MTDAPPPMLFGWGRGGVPGEIASYIAGIETAARLERGETFQDGIRDVSGFQALGVSILAEMFLDDLRGWKDAMRSAKGNLPKLRHEIACWTYILLAYCTNRKAPPPPSLLWLVFESFDLHEGKPAPEFKRIGVHSNVQNMEAFLSASNLDGAADAAGQKISVMGLSRRVGVMPATIRRWREMPEYKRRRDFCAWTAGKALPDFGWSKAVENISRK